MDFTERLKLVVADDFPFREGEDFEAWAARVRSEHHGRRALLAAAMFEVERQMREERSRRKATWIAAARLEFNPGRRQPCFICGRFRSVAEAHHVVPLGRQFDRGFVAADHEHEWLCPSHHAVVHVWIDRILPNDRSWQAHGELDPDESQALVDLVERSNRRP